MPDGITPGSFAKAKLQTMPAGLGWLGVLMALVLASPLGAQSVRLPLPVDSPAGALAFEAAGPPAAVLTGFLLPSAGPLTAWAPVWATLGADGALKESATGGWTGPRPDRWIKVVRAGFVVGGLRMLIQVGPTVQTRQVQIFWKSWSDGAPSGSVVTSRAYGLAAGASEDVRIIELTIPNGAIPIGLYGETVKGTVAQVSLTVKLPALPSPKPPATASTQPGPQAPSLRGPGPQLPSVPNPAKIPE